MKGLAHRLAARAAGTALPVRSDMRLPFGAGGWGEAVETQVDALAPSLPADAAPRTQAPSALASVDPAGAAPAPMADVPVPPTSVLAAHAEPAAFKEYELPGRRATTSREERLPPRLLREGSESRAPMEPHAQRADVPARLEPGAIAALPQSSARQAAPFIAAASSSRPGHAEPARLMPAASARQTPAATVSVAGQAAWAAHSPVSPARAAKAEEATEVHVHIGRIDVTAVHEPTAPRRRPAAAAAPMSLDTYLAKRSRS